MILKADFRCKQVALEVEACVVEKVVELSTAEFDQFCRSMLEKYPFIREARASLHYDDGMRHGFLVLGVGRMMASLLIRRERIMPGTVPLSPTPAAC